MHVWMCGWLHVWTSEDNLWESILLLVGDLWGLTPHFFLTNYIFGLGHQYIILRDRHHLTRHTPFWCWIIIAQSEDSLYFPNAKSNSKQSKPGSSLQRKCYMQLYYRAHASIRCTDHLERPLYCDPKMRCRHGWERPRQSPLWDTVLLWQLAVLTSLLLESLVYRCVSPHPV